MPLRLDPSVELQTAPLRASLCELLGSLMHRSPRFAPLRGRPISLSKACGLHALRVDVDRGTVEPVGQGAHAVLFSKQEPVGWVDYAPVLAEEPDGPAPLRVARIGLGPAVVQICRMIEAAEDLEVVRSGTVELRLLYVNELHLTFGWLWNGSSMFIPVTTGFGFEARALYDEDSFRRRVLTHVESQLASEDFIRHADMRLGRAPPAGSMPG